VPSTLAHTLSLRDLRCASVRAQAEGSEAKWGMARCAPRSTLTSCEQPRFGYSCEGGLEPIHSVRYSDIHVAEQGAYLL